MTINSEVFHVLNLIDDILEGGLVNESLSNILREASNSIFLEMGDDDVAN